MNTSEISCAFAINHGEVSVLDVDPNTGLLLSVPIDDEILTGTLEPLSAALSTAPAGPVIVKQTKASQCLEFTGKMEPITISPSSVYSEPAPSSKAEYPSPYTGRNNEPLKPDNATCA